MPVAKRENAVPAGEIKIRLSVVVLDRRAVRARLDRASRQLHHARERRIHITPVVFTDLVVERLRTSRAVQLRRPTRVMFAHYAAIRFSSRRAIDPTARRSVALRRSLDAHQSLAQFARAGKTLEIIAEMFAHLRNGARFAELVDHRRIVHERETQGARCATESGRFASLHQRGEIAPTSHGLPERRAAEHHRVDAALAHPQKRVARVAESPLPITGISTAAFERGDMLPSAAPL